jgi:hypothetical protein
MIILILSKGTVTLFARLTVVKEGHKWDYAHVKHLCGAGKLYVRLNTNKDMIMEENVEIDFE